MIGSKRTAARAPKTVDIAERKLLRWTRVEEDVAQVVAAMKARGIVKDYIRHEGRADKTNDPADFVVRRRIGRGTALRRFGVATSLASKNVREAMHPQTKVLCFPLGTKPDTIARRILSLFER